MASAAKIIKWAILLVLALALLLSFPSSRLFVLKHPGLIGVLIGVSGEVYFDWKEERGKHANWKRFFMALLVVGLTYELYEASETDKSAADAIKLAGAANERASTNELQVAILESNNLVMRSNVAVLEKEVAGTDPYTFPITSAEASLDISIKMEKMKLSWVEIEAIKRALRVTIDHLPPVIKPAWPGTEPFMAQTFIFPQDKSEIRGETSHSINTWSHFRLEEQSQEDPMAPPFPRLLEQKVGVITNISLVELDLPARLELTSVSGNLKLFFNSTAREFAFNTVVTNQNKIIIWQKVSK